MPTMPVFDLAAFGVSFADYLLTHTAAFGVLLFAALLCVAGCVARILELRWDRTRAEIAAEIEAARSRQDAAERARMDTIVRLSDYRRRTGGNEAA